MSAFFLLLYLILLLLQDAVCLIEYLHQYFPLGGFRLYRSHVVIVCTPHLTIWFRGCFASQARGRTGAHNRRSWGFRVACGSSIYNRSSSGLYLTSRNSSSLARPMRLYPFLSFLPSFRVIPQRVGVSLREQRFCSSKFPVAKLVPFSLVFPCFLIHY